MQYMMNQQKNETESFVPTQTQNQAPSQKPTYKEKSSNFAEQAKAATHAIKQGFCRQQNTSSAPTMASVMSNSESIDSGDGVPASGGPYHHHHYPVHHPHRHRYRDGHYLSTTNNQQQLQ